jgi:hypothetical protein
LFKNAGTLLCAVNRGGIILGDAKETEDTLDGIGVDEGPLSAEEESVLLPFNVEVLFFLEGMLLIDAIVEEPESEELAAEKIFVEGDSDDVDEDDECDLFLLLFGINLVVMRFFGKISTEFGRAGFCICCC